MLLFTILRCITNGDYLSPTAALTNPINKSLHARLIIALLYQLLVYIFIQKTKYFWNFR